MSGNSHNQQPATSNTWLSNILRPRASSVSVESCLNLSARDPSQPLDARPVLPLLDASQPLVSRCKHLAVFSDICKSYRFTHLENVFFTVQDILNPSISREARHTVFEFMLACVSGQYSELGMARVTFYASLRQYTHWADFGDMYKVLYALCQGGRDISGFEKNVCKLLIHWMDMAILHQRQSADSNGIPHLKDILHLLTVTAKFNFALFEESEVTQMILATHKAFFSSNNVGDMQACLEFTDIVVRYRFVPFEALNPFLDILAAAVILIPNGSSGISSWPIFLNLLRSHCAHSSILTLCRFLDKQPSNVDSENILIKGAITLLSETAWGNSKSTGAETYMVPDSVILLYLKRAASKGNDTINGTILTCLTLLLPEHNLSLMEWDAFWDIMDVITSYIIKITDNNSNNDVALFSLDNTTKSSCIQQFTKLSHVILQLYKQKTYKGPLIRMMQVLYQLRAYCCDDTAKLLLDYYVTEHSFLPSTENWLQLLREATNTFFIHANPTTTTAKIRLAMLTIVTNVCTSVKDFYSEMIYETVLIPMMQKLSLETNTEIRQLAIDLLVSCLSDCQNDDIFDQLIAVLKNCAHCQCIIDKQPPPISQAQASKLPSIRTHTTLSLASSSHRSTSSSTISSTATITAANVSLQQHYHSAGCTGASAMCGISDVFENLLLASNGKLCAKTFGVITEIANDQSDLACPSGGAKIVALDLLLRFRCPTNHHVYLIEDNVEEDSHSAIASIRAQQLKKYQEAEQNRLKDSFILGTATHNRSKQPATFTKPVFYPSPNVFSYSENAINMNENEAVLDMDQMLKAYIDVLTYSPNWAVVLFVLKRLPQQLSNKHLFCGASPSVNKLRRRLVKWTSTRKFLECVTNLPSHIKRNDLNVYAYSLLTVLISYRRIFTDPKQDQDEIVYAFYVGIMQVTSATRLCINSLAVCCHEMPLSVAKMLNEILQRMSQIISVSSVSVHILEFLSGLARLPKLYANFTGDMYKPVFAIALNYLQHSHSQQQQQQQQQQQTQQQGQQQHSPLSTPSASPMLSSPNISAGQKEVSQGALKQYVLIMAYLVITVWFTAIPLRERPKHVPFIIQRLLSGISMGKSIDEQTYTCIDMLSRFTFANVSLAPEKSIVSKILMGDGDATTSSTVAGTKQSQRTWVYGHTLLTLRTAKSMGWVEVTIRRPSGTVSMMCYVENKIKSDEIDYRTLPALLMMQYQPDLLASKFLKDRKEEEEKRRQVTVQGLQTDGEVLEEEGEGSALGIIFDEEEGVKRFPAGTATRRPSDQAVVSTTVATRSEGLVMAPSSESTPTTAEQPSSPLISSSLIRRPSLTQKGLIDLLNKDSESSSVDNVTSSGTTPSIATMKTIESASAVEEAPVDTKNSADAAVREVLSDPSSSNSNNNPNNLSGDNSGNASMSQLFRKTEPSMDPGFLYLQFNNYPDLARSIDISPPLPDDEATTRTLNTFDRIPVVDFHKIGVLYVGKGQTHELQILANTYGSPDYVRFLNSLGTIQRLCGFTGNSGGLDRDMDIDGRYAYFWKDDVTEAVFHAATMMPTNLERDPQCSAKKRHIGNDYVSIVYNDSGLDYAFDTLPSQFNFINLVVSPHSISTEAVSPSHALVGAENTFFKVEMQRRPDMPDIGPLSEPKLVSAQSLPGFVRQAAIHANIFAQVFWQSVGAGGKREYVSHWRERLRQIQRVKDRLANKSTPVNDNSNTSSKLGKDGYPYEALLDFTKYT